jgi:hypothetical protein
MYQGGVLFNGGMNTDDEDRLIPNGDYRYAAYSRNYGVNTPMEGAIQSMTGNTLQENTQLPVGVNIIIGSCEDVEHKALILFVWNEYDNHSIWRYTVEDAQYELILQDALLSFQKNNKIYHAAVVNNLLYWTDNFFKNYTNNQFNPPRKINIQKAILYTQSAGTDPEGYTEITFNNLDWIKHPPLFGPRVNYFTDTTETSNNLKNKLYQFRYQYVYDDNEESAWSPISQMILPPSGEYISQTVNSDPFVDNTINVDISTGSSIVVLIRVAYRIGNTGEFFLYKEYNKIQMSWSDYSVETIAFKNETSGPAISNSERNYDLIPQIAKAIEYLPSNEFAIGNYIEGYDKLEITERDISFSQDRYTIDNNKSAFTAPLADFINFYDTGPNLRRSIVSFNNAYGDTFKKYRFQEGDIMPIQLKKLQNYNADTVSPDSILYFTVPYIDPVVWPSDQDKIKALCFVFIGFLGNVGITASLIAPGTYTLGSSPIGWWTVEITGKTWFNQTEWQLSLSPNHESYVSTIIVLRNNNVTRTFKTGATHEFAIQYYDRANRDGTVLTMPAGSVYVPFNTDLSNSELNEPTNNIVRHPYATQITMSIDKNFQPPIWATHYQILYKPSTNISNFQQRSVEQLIYNPDTSIDIVLDHYYLPNYHGASINQTPSKGDFVRFVRQRALFERELNILAIMESTLVDYSLGIVPQLTWVDIPYGPSFSETYDAASYISGYTFTPTAAPCKIDFKHTYSVYYVLGSGIMNMKVRVILRNTTTSSDIILYTQEEPGMYYPNTINDITFSTDVTLVPGNAYIVKLQFIHNNPPSLGGVHYKAFDGKITFSDSYSNYDTSSYFPRYVTNDINNNYELNVLAYKPGAGPSGADIITVNYFDANILGEYLTFTGTSQYRTIATGGFQIEIYTSKKESENDPWYEVGIEWEIENPHTSSRTHTGNINQVLGSLNALVYLNCGDVYIRQRIMSTGYHSLYAPENNINDANDNRGAWFCEDPHYSDYFVSNWNNKGRLGLFSAFAKQQHLKASIYHTNALIDNTQINGLSRVEFFNNAVLKDEHGSINKLMQIGDTLKAFQDKKVSSVYIQKTFALNGDGTNNVIISDKTFAGIRPHDDDYGCIHPGSVAKVENNVFFYDFYNAAVVQATQGGLVNVCDGPHKFSVGIRSFTNDIRDYELTNGEPINIISHINRSNGEYVLYSGTNLDNIPSSIQFEDFDIVLPNFISLAGNYVSIFSEGTVFTITGADYISNNGTYTVAVAVFGGGATNITVFGSFANSERKSPGIITVMPAADLSGQNIVYSFNRQRWSSYMFQPVLWATQFGNRAYTVGGNPTINMGKLYEEDGGGELNFFNEIRIQQIDFLFNSNPTIVKRFLTFMTQSNIPFSVGVSVPPTNQYPTGMASNILIGNFRNQESYYVSKYFRDLGDPNPYLLGVLKRLNGRELRGYVLKHSMTNSDSTNKMILFSANVNFVPSEPIMQ